MQLVLQFNTAVSEHCHPFTSKLPARGLGGAGDKEVVHGGPGQGQKETGYGPKWLRKL